MKGLAELVKLTGLTQPSADYHEVETSFLTSRLLLISLTTIEVFISQMVLTRL